MARPIEEFNPWPAFVDLFASIIMVVLMFLLVLIVNVAYYAQYKYKVFYSGSVAVEGLLLEENLKKQLEKQPIESEDIYTKSNNSNEIEQAIEEKPEKKVEEVKSSGVELTVPEYEASRQENIINLDWMLIKFQQNELILDPATIKELGSFIQSAKAKFANHSVEIFISEPKSQVSATVARQIGLSRAINVRNLIHSEGYEKNEVLVRLRKSVPEAKSIEHKAGYIVVNIMAKGE